MTNGEYTHVKRNPLVGFRDCLDYQANRLHVVLLLGLLALKFQSSNAITWHVNGKQSSFIEWQRVTTNKVTLLTKKLHIFNESCKFREQLKQYYAICIAKITFGNQIAATPTQLFAQ